MTTLHLRLPLLRQLGLATAVATVLFGAAAARAVPLGPAPDFTLDDQDGNPVALSDFAGTGVILDFCTVWCAACQDFYTQVYPTIAGSELVVPVLFQDATLQTSDQAAAQAWATAFGLQTLHLGGDSALENALLSAYFADQSSLLVPTFVFVSAQLEIIDSLEGAPLTASLMTGQWEPRVDAVLATQVPAPPAAPLLVAALAAIAWRRRIRR